MTAPFTWWFTTAASSTTAPTVNSESPAQGAGQRRPVVASDGDVQRGGAAEHDQLHPRELLRCDRQCDRLLQPLRHHGHPDPWSGPRLRDRLPGHARRRASSSGTSPVSWSFTTVGPTVGSVSPPANSTGVPVSFTVSATFNESVQASSITSSDFTLETAAGTLGVTVTYNASTNTATLTPSAALTYSTTYTVSVSGVTDASGHTMASPFTWSFTTAPAALASILSSLTIPTSLRCIWWTPARIQEAKAWWATHSYVPASTDAEGNAFAYVMTGNTQYGMTAVNLLLNFRISAGTGICGERQLSLELLGADRLRLVLQPHDADTGIYCCERI